VYSGIEQKWFAMMGPVVAVKVEADGDPIRNESDQKTIAMILFLRREL